MAQPPVASLADVEALLAELYLAAGARLRDEERQKAAELVPLLGEIARALGRSSRPRSLTLVDAAAGKGYAGLLAAHFLLEPRGAPYRLVLLEREPKRLAAAARAGARLVPHAALEPRAAEVGDPSAWPDEPDLVLALHACGPATDQVIAQVLRVRARRLLLVPCCVGDASAGAPEARALADALGVPRHAPVRRRFVEAMIAARRTWTLEAAGWQTEVVELCSPTVTPHNLLWRARRVGEPGRMAEARARLARLDRQVEDEAGDLDTVDRGDHRHR